MSGKIAKMSDISGCNSVESLLDASNTNWDIKTVDASWHGGPVCIGPSSGGFKALVRPDTNTALAFVGSRFRANSHREQLHTLDTLVRNGDILPVSASQWDDGAVLAYQFQCPGLDVVINGRDMVSPLLTLAFAYGSQLADSAFFADFRWFCKNQMGQVAALSTERCKHRGGIKDRFGDLLMQRVNQLSGELSGRYEAMRRMLNVPLAGKERHMFFGEAIGASREESEQAWVMPPDELIGRAAKIPEVLDCYLEDNAGAEGSVWQAYNAVTRYETHKDGRTPESRARRMLLGSGGATANRAWGLAASLVA